MKIGLVCPYNMFQFAGGVQEIVIQLAKELRGMGHSVKIITPRPRNFSDTVPEGMILLGRSAKLNTPFATMVDFGFEADPEEIENMLAEESFDIIHFHEPWVPVLSRQILSRSKSINIATFHATPPTTTLSKSLLSVVVPYTSSVLKYIDGYSAVSDSAAEYVNTLVEKPVKIIPNAIDLDAFVPSKTKKEQSGKKKILYLGRLEKRKGIPYLLEAYQLLRMKHDDVELVIAGSGVKRAALEKIVATDKIPDVTFLGFIPEQQKVPLIQSADVYCSPAIYGESFGIVLLEAMALHIPVVAGNNPGYSSVMRDEGSISLVNPKSTAEFAQRLDLLLYNNEIRDVWIKWAKKETPQYSFDRIASMYLDLYKTTSKKTNDHKA
jgi:phosphatidylinositol alpha-mannosyltransferase